MSTCSLRVGAIVDGTGSAPFRADVGVVGGVIAATPLHRMSSGPVEHPQTVEGDGVRCAASLGGW